MEAVRAFNNELSSLYETKPPVSRAKMASVTKSATKAIKFYKHVVQSVEKFILKCRPEYKVPGLYVIDSIVRQSRHQFGQDKDVFAPRFTKNITTTFQHLYKCPAEDKSKIVRVLNLWQKNGVFPSEVIQPLMDLAPDPSNPEAISAAQAAVQAAVSAREAAKQAKEQLRPNAAGGAADSLGGEEQNDVLKTVTDLLEQSQEVHSLTAQKQQLQQLQLLQQQLVQQTQLLQQPDTEQQPIIDSNLLSQIQTLANQLLNKSDDEKPSEPTFNKKLLDFDYGESDDDDDRDEQNQKPPGNHMPSHPALMLHPGVPPPGMPVMEQRPEQMGLIPQDHNRLHPGHMQHPPDMILPNTHLPPPNMVIDEPEQGEIEHEPLPVPPLMDGENTRDERDDRDRRRRRSRSRSRSPRRRRRSRSRSRDRRRRSRSRDRHRRSRERDRDREREKREKERERRKLGLPPVKENMLSVCSTTLWIGHLNKQTTEDDLREELGNYGEIASMTLIPPRGCAYVSLTKRKDASRALDRLKGAKLLGNTLKAAWAMGTGIRESSFKENWDVDLGVVHIPWDKLSEVQLDRLAQGGMVDEDSLPEHLKTKIQNEENAQMEGRMDMQQHHHMPNDIHQHQGPPPSLVPGMIPGQHMAGMMPVLPVGVMPPPIMGMPHIGVPPPGVVPSPLASLVPGMQLQQRPGLDLAAALATSSTTQPGLLVPPPSVVQAPSGGETPTEAEPPTSVKLVTQPGVSLGNPLQQAIQNLVNNSASISAVAQTGPGGLPQAVSIATGIRPPRLPFDQTIVQAALPRFALQPPDGLTPDAPPRPQGPIPGLQALEGSPSTNHKQEGENRDLLGQAGQQQAGLPQIQSLLGPRLGLPPGDAGARPPGLAAVKLHAPPNDRLPRPGMDRPNGDPAGPDGPPGLPGSPMHRFAAPFGGPMGMRGPPGMGPPMRLRFRGLEPNMGMRPRFNRGHFAPELRMDFVRFGPGGPRPRGGDFRRGGPGRGRDFRPPFMGRRHPGDIDDHLAHNADENSDSGNAPGAQDDGPVD